MAAIYYAKIKSQHLLKITWWQNSESSSLNFRGNLGEIQPGLKLASMTTQGLALN